jgi:beta-fructofuranosidase
MREVSDLEEGWIGAHSVPYTLSLDQDVLVATPSEALVRYRGGVSPNGLVEGLAADVVWTPGNTLTIGSGGKELVSLVVDESTLTLQQGSRVWSMPYVASELRIIVDGPVLEVVSPSGLISCAVTPEGADLEFLVDGGAITVWTLERPAH